MFIIDYCTSKPFNNYTLQKIEFQAGVIFLFFEIIFVVLSNYFLIRDITRIYFVFLEQKSRFLFRI